MREISLHILDLVQNGIEAGARNILISLNENNDGYFVFSIKDDGHGMSEETLKNVRDPFTTSRTTRKVGMGIPFIDMMTKQCGGNFDIESEKGKGTLVTASFKEDNIDRPPLGDFAKTMKVMIVGAPQVDFEIVYGKGRESFICSTKEIKKILGADTDFTNPLVYEWVENYIRNEIEKLDNK